MTGFATLTRCNPHANDGKRKLLSSAKPDSGIGYIVSINSYKILTIFEFYFSQETPL